MGTFLFSRVGGVLVVALKFLGGEMSDQLRYLITLNCLDGNMKCYQWARSIPLETKLTKHTFWQISTFVSHN